MLHRRMLLQAGLAGFIGSHFSLAGCAQAQTSRTSLPRYDLSSIHPELRAGANDILSDYHTGDRIRTTAETILERRGNPSAQKIDKATYPFASEVFVDVNDAAPPVRTFIVKKNDKKLKPALIYIHGGGHLFGSSLGAIPRFESWMDELDCVVIAPEYRLAPETTFEGSMEDNYSVLLWTYKNAEALGIDPNRIAVMGSSAGGGHAALLSFTAKERGEVPICFQCLVYPMLDDRTGSPHIPDSYSTEVIWSLAENKLGWSSFLGVEAGSTNVPVRAVPARRTDLNGLPPTFICVGTADLFFEENKAFAENLIKAGVETDLYVAHGAYHAFDNIASDTRVAKRFNAAKIDALRRHFTL